MAAGHEATATVALEVLAEGGTAFDAVIAALWTACAAEPVLASPGGGGFLLAAPAGLEPTLYDFFVHTPKQRREDEDFHEIMVDFGVAQQAFHIGLGAAAAAGFVRGLFDLHHDRATMPMARLIEPAVRAAREGVVLTAYQAYLLRVVSPIYDLAPEVREVFCCGERTDCDPGLRSEGDLLCNPALADTLEALGREGGRLFYEGELAEEMVRQCREGGGHLRREDLADYRTALRTPLRRRYRDAVLSLNPPPSAGGVLIAFALDMLERCDLSGEGLDSMDRAEALVAAMATTNRARAEVMGDGAGRSDLLDPDLLERYAREVLSAPPASRGTTHVSVIDDQGNAAAATVSNGEGCSRFVPDRGFMLNNMLGEEDLCAGAAGRWNPDRRMSSMMAPTAISWDDGGFAVLGSGGSNRIRTAILQVLSNLVDLRLPPREAVDAPRVHLEGVHLDFEDILADAMAERLAELHPDHTRWPDRNMFFGGVHTAMRTSSGELLGAGDGRRAGVVVRR